MKKRYNIKEPKEGWKRDFSKAEKAKLRPIAETLAMLDGNAFFGNESRKGVEWYEMYLPEAHALYEGNGGDNGWAGDASFAQYAIKKSKKKIKHAREPVKGEGNPLI